MCTKLGYLRLTSLILSNTIAFRSALFAGFSFGLIAITCGFMAVEGIFLLKKLRANNANRGHLEVRVTRTRMVSNVRINTDDMNQNGE